MALRCNFIHIDLVFILKNMQISLQLAKEGSVICVCITHLALLVDLAAHAFSQKCIFGEHHMFAESDKRL
jgi:Holliday junction resolvasome RuvABC endonuclease subunit